MSELKPCPFCLDEGEPIKSRGYWTVYCNCCGVQTTEDIDKKVAITTWNKRPIEDKLEAEVSVLKALRKGYIKYYGEEPIYD